MNLEPEDFDPGDEVTEELRNPAPAFRISVRLTNEEARSLLAEAKRTGVSTEDLAEQAIRDFIAERSRLASRAAS